MDTTPFLVPPAAAAPTPIAVAAAAAAAVATACASTILPAQAVLLFGQGQPATTLADVATLRVNCDPSNPSQTAAPLIIANNGISIEDNSVEGPQYTDFRDPFYASIFPVCYALAATTVTAYMLVIMLFVTPRSFLDGGIVYLGRRGFTGNSSGGISIGGRPWLQKVAALTVAISLTIATVDTFRLAERQYSFGIPNVAQLQNEVMDGTELKVIRLISDTFLWLAQAQTLIRLFSRQREKIIIKWTAFALITLDVIFSALNSFQYTTSGSNGNSRPRSFVEAVPALSYLFQLSLGLLYAAWVIYYALMKKRYAFYHPLMKNMILVSSLSVLSILVPVVFFVLDISKPEFTVWGDYVRWVGAAAASVVVWEWVERIEALEREEKKDGILGREIFDGDDVLEVSASEFPWLRRRKNRNGRDGRGNGGNGGADGGEDGQVQQSANRRPNLWPGMSSITTRYRGTHGQPAEPTREERPQVAQRSVGTLLRPQLWPSRPPAAVTPVSRTDTASAASTVYAVRYQAISETASRTPDAPVRNNTDPSRRDSVSSDRSSGDDARAATVAAPVPQRPVPETRATDLEQDPPVPRIPRIQWRSLAQVADPLFRKGGQGPPAAVAPHTNPRPDRPPVHEDASRWDLRSRLEDFAVSQADKLREKMRPTPETDSLPVTVIPAPPRRGAALARLLEEEELAPVSPSASMPRAAGAGTRDVNDASAYSAFSTSGPAPVAALERCTSSFSARSRPLSQPSEPSMTQPTRPPLWPGVQVQFDPDQGSGWTAASPTRSRRFPDDPAS